MGLEASAGEPFAGSRTDVDELLAAALRGDRRPAGDVVKRCRARGVSVQSIYLDLFEPCLVEVGRRWECGRISVAQEHLVTAVVQSLMASLYPEMFSETPSTGPTVLVVTVGANLHEIGARMLADFYEMAGFNTVYLGANLPADEIARSIHEVRPRCLALSASLSGQLGEVRRAVDLARETSVGRGLLIGVGGGAFSHHPIDVRELGADFTAPDAKVAIEITRRRLREMGESSA